MPTTVIPSTPGLPLFAFTCRNAAFRFSRSHTASINRFVLAGFSVPFLAPDDSDPSLPASRASPVGSDEKSSSLWIFCCWSSLRLMAYWPLLLVRAFGHSFRLGLSIAPPFGFRSASLALPTSRPNMPSADFCSAVRPPCDSLSPLTDTEQISWGKLSRLLCGGPSGDAGSTLRTLDGYGLRGKLPARPALAPNIRFCPSTRTFAIRFFQTPPRGGSPCVLTRPSPPSGWPEDSHLQAAEHAQHTTKPLCGRPPGCISVTQGL